MKLDSFTNRFGTTQSAFQSPRGHRPSAGQSVVELALMLPVLMLIMIGTLDLGRLVDAYVVMTNAAREGARYGMNNPTDTTGIQNKARAAAANSGYQTAQMTISSSCNPNCTDNGNAVVVQVSYPFTMITTYMFGATTITVQTQTQMAIFR